MSILASRIRRADAGWGFLVVVLVLLTWLPRLSGPIDLRWDAGVYYVLGTSLAEGNGYRLLNEPGEILATQYPPLLPALIAAHQVVAGTNDPTLVGRRLRLTYFAISVLLGLGGYALMRGYLSPVWAAAGASVLVLHTTTVFLSDTAFAELPFMVVTVLFFVTLSASSLRHREIWAALFASAAFLLRTTGLALLVAWVLEGFVRRGGVPGVQRLLVLLVVVCGWQAYIAGVERSAAYAETRYAYQRADYLFYNVSYLRNFWYVDAKRPEAGQVSVRGLAERVARNLSGAPLRAGESLSAPPYALHKQLARGFRILGLRGEGMPSARVSQVGLVILGGCALAGVVLQFLRGDILMPLFVAFYLGGIALTPWTYSDRYWIALAPMMIVGLVYFIKSAGALASRYVGDRRLSAARFAVAGAAGIVLGVQGASLSDLFRARHQVVAYRDLRGDSVEYRLFYYRGTYRALDRGLDQIRGEARPDVVVAASMPHWVFLRTGMKAVMVPFEPDPAGALRLLESVPVRYLIVDGRARGFTQEYGFRAVQHAPEIWREVYSGDAGSVRIFERLGASSGSERSALSLDTTANPADVARHAAGSSADSSVDP